VVGQNGYVKNVVYLLGGVAVGAAAALLMAPYSGRRMRRTLRRKTEDATDFLEDTGQELRERSKHIAKDVAHLVDRATHVMSR
jgi:gas vesicle protein